MLNVWLETRVAMLKHERVKTVFGLKNAHTHQTTNITVRYTANVVSALLLFDSLGTDWADPDEPLVMADGTELTRSAAYSRARDIAIAWQQDSPEKTQVEKIFIFSISTLTPKHTTMIHPIMLY